MTPKSEVEIEAQINTLYMLRDLCQQNGFRTIQYMEVSKKYSVSISALREEEKFPKCIGSGICPDDIEAVRRNLIQLTVFGKEIESNTGNEHNVLDSLRDTIRRLEPDLAQTCDAVLKTYVEQDELDDETSSNKPDHQNDESDEGGTDH